MALYSSAGGHRWILQGWTHNECWGTGAELSQWFGVDVNAEGRVVKLDLSNNNLKGITTFFPGALGEPLELVDLTRGAVDRLLSAMCAPFRSRFPNVSSPLQPLARHA